MEECSNYDFLCFTETKIDDTLNDLVIEKLDSIGFKVFFKNRKSLMRHKSGGLLIAVKKPLVPFTEEVDSESRLVQWLKFDASKAGYCQKFLIGNVYIPPRHSRHTVDEPFDVLEEELTRVLEDDVGVIICGDCNAHTGLLEDYIEIDESIVQTDQLSNINVQSILENAKLPMKRSNQDINRHDTYGVSLAHLCRNTGLIIANGRLDNGKPTTSANTLIDYLILSPDTVSRITGFMVHDFDPLFSDMHCGISFSIVDEALSVKECIESDDTTCNIQVIGKWDKDNADTFVNTVRQAIEKVNDKIQDMSVAELSKTLNSVYVGSAKSVFGTKEIPQKKKRSKKSFVWYNNQCYTLKKAYRQALSRHRRTKSQETLQALIYASKMYKKEVKKAKKVHVTALNKQLLQLKNSDPRNFWKLINAKPTFEEIPVPIEELSAHFSKLNTEEYVNNVDLTNTVDLQPDQIQLGNLNERISNEEIQDVANKLKNNKACGSDLVSNEYIKTSLPVLLPILNVLFNKVLDTGIIPEEWSAGIIVPIFKKGNRKEPSNYRGITLLSCVGKLFTSLLNNRLSKFLEDNKTLLENQAGFRKNYSTLDHCFLLKHLIDICKSRRKKLFCAFVDFKQAFDRVWRDGLWYKLQSCGITGKFYNVILNMYKNIKSCVMLNGNVGEYFVSNIGVRQGENLSPLLFSIYLNDLENYLDSNGNTRISFDLDICNELLRVMVILYADDTVLISDSAQGLQRLLSTFSEYCSTWKLTVNASKTKIVVFGARNYKGKTVFKYDESIIDVVDEFKYLGILFKQNGSFKSCRKYLYSQAQKAMFSLLCRCRQFNLPPSTCLYLFDKMIVPIMSYGSEIWSYEKDSYIEKLHLKFGKYILGLKSSTPNVMVYGELGRYPLDIELKLKALGFWLKLVNGDEDKLSCKMYECLLWLHYNNIYSSAWIIYIEEILNSCGLTYIWTSQGNNICAKWLKYTVKDILQAQFVTRWYADLENSSKCYHYRNFKQLFECENYLSLVPSSVYKFILKFRTCNHKLPIEVGRYTGVDRRYRICGICDLGDVGDEYHYLFKCSNTNLVNLRQSVLPMYYQRDLSIFKFYQFMQNQKDEQLLFSISKFIKVIFASI